MSIGFKVKLPPPRKETPVIAPPGAPACKEKWPGEHGTYCERPKGHVGGHLSESRSRYWPREEATS